MCIADVLPVTVTTLEIDSDTFKNEIPENLSYSNADIAIYIFGDFLRSLGMLSKLFIYAPVITALLLNEAGIPGEITSILMVGIWIVYMVGIAQFLAKYSLEGNS